MNLDPRAFDPRAFGAAEPGAQDAAQTLAEASARAMWERDAASKALGVRLDDIGPGRATMVMTVRADMVDAFGSCHGAFLFALAHSCCAYACNSHGGVTLAVGCQVDYLLAAVEGDVLQAVAEERSRSGRTSIHDVTVRNAAGQVVALFRGKGHETAAQVAA